MSIRLQPVVFNPLGGVSVTLFTAPMPKRFSARELALLTAPVLFLAGLGFWISRRPPAATQEGKWHLKFHVEQPTTLEAFQGYEGAFVVEALDPTGKTSTFRQGAPYLELKTPHGLQSTRFRNINLLYGVNPWGGNLNNSRFTFRLGKLPAGDLSFGFDGVVSPTTGSLTPIPPVRLSGKWKVDRAGIHTTGLAALPRKPLVVMESATFDGQTSANVSGTIQFSLLGGGMDDSTPFESALTSNGNGASYGTSVGNNSVRTRVIEWTTSRNSTTKLIRLSGRVSAGNHWPLGFEIVPFDASHLKIGQALKFKQAPVASPSSQG